MVGSGDSQSTFPPSPLPTPSAELTGPVKGLYYGDLARASPWDSRLRAKDETWYEFPKEVTSNGVYRTRREPAHWRTLDDRVAANLHDLRISPCSGNDLLHALPCLGMEPVPTSTDPGPMHTLLLHPLSRKHGSPSSCAMVTLAATPAASGLFRASCPLHFSIAVAAAAILRFSRILSTTPGHIILSLAPTLMKMPAATRTEANTGPSIEN